MAKAPDFSKPPAPARPTQAMSRLRSDQPPLRPGQIYIDDTVKRELKPFGYNEGDPMPAGLADRIAEINQEIASAKPDLDPSTPPAKPKQIRSLTDMPREYQQEIADMLKEARETAPLHEAAEKAAAAKAVRTSTMHPTVASVVDMADNAANSEGPTIIDDAVSPPKIDDILDKDSPARFPLTHCPRCQFDLSMEEDNPPTEKDRVAFIAAMVGRTRYRERVAIADGAIVVTFRSLLSKEAKMAMQQVGYDTANNEIRTEAEWYMSLMNYRLAMSIESIETSDHQAIADVPAISEIPYTPQEGCKETPCKPLLNFVIDEILPDESLMRIVGQHHRRFQRKVEAMEAQTHEPSFYRGIGSRT